MRGATALKLAGLIVFIVGVGWILKVLGVDLTTISPERVRGFVLSFGLWAPVVYLVAY